MLIELSAKNIETIMETFVGLSGEWGRLDHEHPVVNFDDLHNWEKEYVDYIARLYNVAPNIVGNYLDYVHDWVPVIKNRSLQYR